MTEPVTMTDIDTVTLSLPGGDVPFALAAGTGPALFALGVRKSGSSIFANVATALARANGVGVVDIPGTMFSRGFAVADWNHARIVPLVRPGNLYVGFRDAPTALFDADVFRAGRKILMVRDPRDALVSEYFSNAYSHALPEVNAAGSTVAVERERALASSLADYVVRRAAPLDRTVSAYAALLDDPLLLVMRYEDVILDKGPWLRAIAAQFGLAADEDLVGRILGWADIRPEAEDPTRFVRRVVPGDHLDKLSAATIAAIDAQLSPVWARLGYRV